MTELSISSFKLAGVFLFLSFFGISKVHTLRRVRKLENTRVKHKIMGFVFVYSFDGRFA